MPDQPESKIPKKQKQIVETATDLFTRFGIKRVTVEEICQEAGASKMTFYKHFRNKTALAKRILEEMTAERMGEYESLMSQPLPFKEKVRRTIQMKMEHTHDLSQEFFADINKQADPELLGKSSHHGKDPVVPILET